MKGLVCDCRNAIRLTATAGVSAIFAGADVAAWSTAPNVMRKVLDIKNVSNTSYGTIGKTRPVVALRTRASALVGTITEYIKAIGRSRKTNWLGNSVSGTGNTIRQRTLSMRGVNAPQILGKQYSPLRELPQPVFQRLSSQLYMASLVWGSVSMLRGGRTKERQYTPDHPEYVALTSALKGGYFSGFFEAVCVFLVILSAQKTVKVSATIEDPNMPDKIEFYEVMEEEVIASGLITKSVVVNEGLENYLDESQHISEEFELLFESAELKRKEIVQGQILIFNLRLVIRRIRIIGSNKLMFTLMIHWKLC